MNEFYQQVREQVARVWENLSIQQKVLFVAAPAILLIALLFAVYLASRPQMVTLVRSENPAELERIVQKLEEENFKYELPNPQTILVEKSQFARASMKLANENLIGADTGVGWGLFDQTRLGMTDRMFDVNYKQAMQDEIEATIIRGADNITDARVHITFPEPGLFRDDSVPSSASVQIISRGTISQDQVIGIQNLVAASVPKLEPKKVVILGRNNKLLSEAAAAEVGVEMKTKQLEVQLAIEDILRRKVEDALHIMVGENNYDVKVTAVLDWTKERIDQTEIQTEAAAPISEKTYEEENSSPSPSGPPGIVSNVSTQDAGIGPQMGMNSIISESITNYQYPWTKIMREMPTGEIKEIAVSIALNYVEDKETGERVPRSPELIEVLRRRTRAVVGLPPDEAVDSIHKFVLVEYPFDDTHKKLQASAKMWSNIETIVTSVLPIILILVLGYFVYAFFNKAFAPIERESEEEEIPIEPVTDAKELTLSQLGLAHFGDIASLPAEEQRRLKMQEHVVNYAAEKPEEVAAIIKAWLSG